MEQATQDKVASRATGCIANCEGCTGAPHCSNGLWNGLEVVRRSQGESRIEKGREDKMGLVMQFGKCNKLEIVLRFGSVFRIICIHTFE